MKRQNHKAWNSYRGVILLAPFLLALIGCGVIGDSNPGGGTNATGRAFVFIGDEPPLGSTVLKFEIELASAILCPQVGAAGECQDTSELSQVPLIDEPIEVELKQLELESAFLSLVSVPAGVYEGVKLTFADPELKIMLDDGTVQELEAPADFAFSQSMVTPTFEGGPLSVTARTNFGFLIDFNFFDSIQSSGNTVVEVSLIVGGEPVVRLVKLPAIAEQEIEELDDVTGQVANLSVSCDPPSGTFDLIDAATGVLIPDIRIDDETEFEDDLTCATFANDQIVEIEAELRAGATLETAEFVAEEIEFVNFPEEDDFEGMVFDVNGPSQFVLLVQEVRDIPDVGIGHFVTVNLPLETEFRIDEDDLPIGGLSFESGDDVMVGQRVEVDVLNGTLVIVPSGCSTIGVCTAVAEKIKLKDGSLTAQVTAVDIDNLTFTLEELPSIFGSAGLPRGISADCLDCSVDSILVRTSSQTEFEDTVENVSDLNFLDIVTVRGLLFKNGFGAPSPGTGTPELIAGRVRRRAP